MVDYRFGSFCFGWQEEKNRELFDQLTKLLPKGVRVVDYAAADDVSIRILIDDLDNVENVVEQANLIYRDVMRIGPHPVE